MQPISDREIDAVSYILKYDFRFLVKNLIKHKAPPPPILTKVKEYRDRRVMIIFRMLNADQQLSCFCVYTYVFHFPFNTFKKLC